MNDENQMTERVPKQPWKVKTNSMVLNGYITLIREDAKGNVAETSYLNKDAISEVVVTEGSETVMIEKTNGVKIFVLADGLNITVSEDSGGGGGGGGGGYFGKIRLIDSDIPEDKYDLGVFTGRMKLNPAEED